MSNFYFGNRCSGLCYNGKDDDCDGDIDFADSDCYGVEGAYCSSDSQCCSAMPFDDPEENNGDKCGCPTGFTWLGGTCVFTEADCTAPPSNCDVNPLQVACLSTYIPWNPVQGCCYFDTYEGTTYYDWDVAHITTY